ncbi:MAG: hypothetical protein HPM95_21205 [Alphaproteobacteria bacterium]|nr:hypothetical protein [Alphaproteobacteria bacterium]
MPCAPRTKTMPSPLPPCIGGLARTYRGIIDGRELERMISKRGPKWRTAPSRGDADPDPACVAGTPAGYATFGRSRMR